MEISPAFLKRLIARKANTYTSSVVGLSPRQHAKMNGCFIQNFGQRVKMDTGPHLTVGTNWD